MLRASCPPSFSSKHSASSPARGPMADATQGLTRPPLASISHMTSTQPQQTSALAAQPQQKTNVSPAQATGQVPVLQMAPSNPVPATSQTTPPVAPPLAAEAADDHPQSRPLAPAHVLPASTSPSHYRVSAHMMHQILGQLNPAQLQHVNAQLEQLRDLCLPGAGPPDAGQPVTQAAPLSNVAPPQGATLMQSTSSSAMQAQQVAPFGQPPSGPTAFAAPGPPYQVPSHPYPSFAAPLAQPPASDAIPVTGSSSPSPRQQRYVTPVPSRHGVSEAYIRMAQDKLRLALYQSDMACFVTGMTNGDLCRAHIWDPFWGTPWKRSLSEDYFNLLAITFDRFDLHGLHNAMLVEQHIGHQLRDKNFVVVPSDSIRAEMLHALRISNQSWAESVREYGAVARPLNVREHPFNSQSRRIIVCRPTEFAPPENPLMVCSTPVWQDDSGHQTPQTFDAQQRQHSIAISSPHGTFLHFTRHEDGGASYTNFTVPNNRRAVEQVSTLLMCLKAERDLHKQVWEEFQAIALRLQQGLSEVMSAHTKDLLKLYMSLRELAIEICYVPLEHVADEEEQARLVRNARLRATMKVRPRPATPSEMWYLWRQQCRICPSVAAMLLPA